MTAIAPPDAEDGPGFIESSELDGDGPTDEDESSDVDGDEDGDEDRDDEGREEGDEDTDDEGPGWDRLTEAAAGPLSSEPLSASAAPPNPSAASSPAVSITAAMFFLTFIVLPLGWFLSSGVPDRENHRGKITIGALCER
ncbi:hypothetical protein [Actinoplanes xinjiangensis]|uniref:hypothetical protein n=1 Tax=Actinoplanes xinjiangensis TaxID=512350 RepID=UPI0034377FC5